MTAPKSRSIFAFGPLPWLGALLAIYLLVPLVGLLVHAGSSGSGFKAPGLGSALRVSVITATLSTVVCAVLGIPLAYVLARRRGRALAALGVAVQLPLALPPLMSGILLVSLVGPYTFIGKAFGGRLTDSLAGIVLAQTFVAAPFAIIAARSAFGSVDQQLLDVAATLGWREWHRFWRVSLPIAAPGIQAGLALAWLRAFGEFGATVILAYHPYSLPVFTYVQFGSTGLSQTLAPTILALAAAAVLLGVARIRPPLVRRSKSPIPRAAEPQPLTPARIAFDLDHRVGGFHLKLSYAAHTQRIAILGASGAGKTVTLRCLAGLFGSPTGEVSLGSRSLGDLAAEERRVGYVPQETSLMPHMTAWRQIVSGRHSDASVGAYWLRALELAGLEDRLPGELSGGQRQRLALARALAGSSQLLLLDEPFSALDAPVRDLLRREVRRVLIGTGMSAVLVTHDPEEAALLADEILVIEDGRLLQGGRREEVFTRPASARVAELLGIENIRTGTMAAPDLLSAGGQSLEVPDVGLREGEHVTWCVRPEDVTVEVSGRGIDAMESHRGTVLEVIDLGGRVEVLVRLQGGLELASRSRRFVGLEPGDECSVAIPKESLVTWPQVPMDAAEVS